jgi:hypothetical protein
MPARSTKSDTTSAEDPEKAAFKERMKKRARGY